MSGSKTTSDESGVSKSNIDQRILAASQNLLSIQEQGTYSVRRELRKAEDADPRQIYDVKALEEQPVLPRFDVPASFRRMLAGGVSRRTAVGTARSRMTSRSNRGGKFASDELDPEIRKVFEDLLTKKIAAIKLSVKESMAKKKAGLQKAGVFDEKTNARRLRAMYKVELKKKLNIYDLKQEVLAEIIGEDDSEMGSAAGENLAAKLNTILEAPAGEAAPKPVPAAKPERPPSAWNGLRGRVGSAFGKGKNGIHKSLGQTAIPEELHFMKKATKENKIRAGAEASEAKKNLTADVHAKDYASRWRTYNDFTVKVAKETVKHALENRGYRNRTKNSSLGNLVHEKGEKDQRPPLVADHPLQRIKEMRRQASSSYENLLAESQNVRNALRRRHDDKKRGQETFNDSWMLNDNVEENDIGDDDGQVLDVNQALRGKYATPEPLVEKDDTRASFLHPEKDNGEDYFLKFTPRGPHLPASKDDPLAGTGLPFASGYVRTRQAAYDLLISPPRIVPPYPQPHGMALPAAEPEKAFTSTSATDKEWDAILEGDIVASEPRNQPGYALSQAKVIFNRLMEAEGTEIVRDYDILEETVEMCAQPDIPTSPDPDPMLLELVEHAGEDSPRDFSDSEGQISQRNTVNLYGASVPAKGDPLVLKPGLQKQLEALWEMLEFPVAQKLDMVVKYTDSEKLMKRLESSVKVWLTAAEAVVAREKTLTEMEELVNHYSKYTPFQKTAGSVYQFKEKWKEINAKLEDLGSTCHETVVQVFQDCSDVVSYQGRPYLDKLSGDEERVIPHLKVQAEVILKELVDGYDKKVATVREETSRG